MQSAKSMLYKNGVSYDGNYNNNNLKSNPCDIECTTEKETERHAMELKRYKSTGSRHLCNPGGNHQSKREII